MSVGALPRYSVFTGVPAQAELIEYSSTPRSCRRQYETQTVCKPTNNNNSSNNNNDNNNDDDNNTNTNDDDNSGALT